MVQPFRALLGSSLRLLDRFTEIHVRGQFCSSRQHQPHFRRHWELAFLEGTTPSEFDSGDHLLRVGDRLDQFRGYGDLEGDPDRRWVGSCRRDHGISLLSCGTEDEKGSESLGLRSTGLCDSGPGVSSTLCLVPESFHGYSSSTYLMLFLLALIPQLIGHTTYNWALKYLPASMVAIATLGEPVGSTILAYFILGEQLTSLKVAGGISIFIGILIAVKKETAHK